MSAASPELHIYHDVQPSVFAHSEAAMQLAQEYIESVVGYASWEPLMGSFGVQPPACYDRFAPRHVLSWLKGISNVYLDTRSGKERDQIEPVEFTDEQTAIITEIVNESKMKGESNATQSHYDFIGVLGGRRDKSWKRMQHAKKQFTERGVQAEWLLLLGSSRPVDENERSSTAAFAPSAQTEFDLNNAAFELEFGVTEYQEVSFDSAGVQVDFDTAGCGRVRFYMMPNGTKVLSVSAPPIEGNSRANTADTYRFIDAILANGLREGKSLLAITTDIFVPFQHADALRLHTLGRGMSVETIGYKEDSFDTQAYANEINAMLNQTYLLKDELMRADDYHWLRLKRPEDTARVITTSRELSETAEIGLGGIALRIAKFATEERRERESALAAQTFDGASYRRVATLEGVRILMRDEIEWRIDHDEPMLGGPEFLSPYAFAAMHDVRIIPPNLADQFEVRPDGVVRHRIAV